MKVYLENRHKIARHNALHQKGEVTFSMEMNHFGDLVCIKFFYYLKYALTCACFTVAS